MVIQITKIVKTPVVVSFDQFSSNGQSAVIVIDVISVENLPEPFCCVLGKDIFFGKDISRDFYWDCVRTSYCSVSVYVGAEMAFRRFAGKGTRDEMFIW